LLAALPAVAAGQEVTYTRDVAPILFKRCAGCHRPGEVGPFPLLTYNDAAKKARHLKEVTASRRMPPWLPEPGAFKFVDERRLTDAELGVLARWADSGVPEGDARDLPPLPKFIDGWQLGEPDVVVKLSRPFTIPADGPDIYQAFVIPLPAEEVRWVRGVEFRPGNRRVAHHANIFLDSTGQLRKRAEKEDGPGFRTMAGFELQSLLGKGGSQLSGWRPGTTPQLLPDGLASPLRPGVDLIIHVHYHPTGKVEFDQPSLGLYFTKTPGKKFIVGLPIAIAPHLGNAHLLNIPAGAQRHTAAVSRTLPGAARVFAVTAHAHYLLREVTLTAELPDGQRLVLLEIKHWDFDQQDRYRFADPPLLPKGTKIDLAGTFDNSADNPQNPNQPPKAVRWGPNTTDEMLAALIGLIPEDAEAAKSIVQLALSLSRPEGKEGKDGKPAGRPRLPPGGAPIPADAKLIREKYDKNKDGKLTRDELEAIPSPLREKIEAVLRERYGTEDEDPPAVDPPKQEVHLWLTPPAVASRPTRSVAGRGNSPAPGGSPSCG
jgi:hypothetical protein